MAKKTVTPEVYNATVGFLEDRINIYKVFAASAKGEEMTEKFELMKEESEEILQDFTKRYTWRKRRYYRKQDNEKAES